MYKIWGNFKEILSKIWLKFKDIIKILQSQVFKKIGILWKFYGKFEKNVRKFPKLTRKFFIKLLINIT